MPVVIRRRRLEAVESPRISDRNRGAGVPGKNGNGFTVKLGVSSGENVRRGGSVERRRGWEAATAVEVATSPGGDSDGTRRNGGSSVIGVGGLVERVEEEVEGEVEDEKRGWGTAETEKIGLGIVTAPGVNSKLEVGVATRSSRDGGTTLGVGSS